MLLNNLNTGESIKAEFLDGKVTIKKSYAVKSSVPRIIAPTRLNRSIPACLITFIVCRAPLGTSKPVQLISGYRSVDTNNELRAHSRGVAKHSYHTKGQAMDFHIEGIQLSNIRKAALKYAPVV